ncbi:MAG: hypothetical protein Q4B09_10215 [Lachnospiraceae bacterium]|nr:hypothetical protein [Lachnospiraceae bacterium]
MNPMNMMKMRERLTIFQNQHPKVFPFLQYASSRVEEGSIIEVKVTSPAGEETITNIKVTKEDLETVAMMREQ